MLPFPRVALPVVGALFLGLASVACLAADPPPGVEGLVEVKAKRMDSAWLLPDTDFRPYTKVIIDPAEVAFRKYWMRDINRDRGISRRVDEKDAREIAEAARSGFAEVFAKAYTDAGYTIVNEPGPDVLRLTPAIVDLYINAPDVAEPGITHYYTVDAGEARLILEARDSQTGALLGVAVDRRIARGDGGAAGIGQLRWTTRVSNYMDFERMYRAWANISVKGLQELKEQSPVNPTPRR